MRVDPLESLVTCDWFVPVSGQRIVREIWWFVAFVPLALVGAANCDQGHRE